jgi:hypothetical protein
MLRAKCGSVGLSKSVMQSASIIESFRFSKLRKSKQIETTQCSDFVDIFSTKSKLFVVSIFLENRLGASTYFRRSFFGRLPKKEMLRAKCGSVGLSDSIIRNASIVASFRPVVSIFEKYRNATMLRNWGYFSTHFRNSLRFRNASIFDASSRCTFDAPFLEGFLFR